MVGGINCRARCHSVPAIDASSRISLALSRISLSMTNPAGVEIAASSYPSSSLLAMNDAHSAENQEFTNHEDAVAVERFFVHLLPAREDLGRLTASATGGRS